MKIPNNISTSSQTLSIYRMALSALLILLPCSPLLANDEPAQEQKQSSDASEKQYTGEPISLELSNADLVEVLESFGKIAGFETHISPEVSGKVTVMLDGVPWDQALDELIKIHDLVMKVEDRVMHIAPAPASSPAPVE